MSATTSPAFQTIKERFDLGDVIALSTRQDQADWIAMRIRCEVDFAADLTARMP
ncbi:MAG: hypothetical protein WA790_01005 [Sulfitobacter sp.]